MEIRVFVEGPVDANNYLLFDAESKEAVLIDCSAPSLQIIDAIKKENLILKYILLTHGHFDHILGVDKFNEVFNVDIYVGKDDLEQIESTPAMIQMFTGVRGPEVLSVKKNVNDGDEFFIGKTKIKAIATPGHTEGGMCYLAEDKLFSGDTLFNRSIGRTDFPGGDFQKITHSVKDILFSLPDDTIVYPGHGAKTTIAYEKKYNEILKM